MTDHENRLTQAVIGGTTSTYAYNGDGLRASRTSGGSTTTYTWDVAAGLPVVLQDGANTYVYGLDLISATDGGGVQRYFLYDGLGSTRGLANSSGEQTVSYGYDAFGAMRAQTGSSPNYGLFTGEQRDIESGIYYLRARYYDAAIGRFLTRDPFAGFTASPRASIPTSMWPTGPSILSTLGAFVGLAVGAILAIALSPWLSRYHRP